ncbi:DegT/DnrJ/EryC1/StrS family aminotransferase [Candidatus Pelagibacter sp. Uisw_127]|uniref:DegT/DnrJ/EryC1/StrS family aminotransferase n=1 Tax=Candidatus Pelagibacter sp. Uisw_127 TaxID=3230988 RepID=UPI0039EC262A
MKPIFFTKGRHALVYGLKNLNLKKNDELMLPTLICDVVIEEIKILGIKPVYYNINNKFDADWKDIKKKFSTKIKGIIMVHFFGKPQMILKYRNFCKSNKIYLIEDNCHGFNGLKPLGKIGKYSDIVITSPNKIIKEIDNGGVLFIKKEKKLENRNYISLSRYKKNIYHKFKDQVKKIKFIKKLYRYIFNRPDYEDINISKIKNKLDLRLDKYTENNIKNFSFKKEKALRISRFNLWKNTLNKFNIKPYFEYNDSDNYILWYFVAKIENYHLRKKFYDWGWKNTIDIVSWPSFPKEFKKNNLTFKFSRRFVLFPLNQDFKDIDLL